MWSFGTTMTMPKDRESESASAQPSQPPQPEPIPQALPTPSTPLEATHTSVLSPRSLRQLGLFFAGAGFLTLSTIITRRSVAKKVRATVPRFFIPSNRPVEKMGGDSSLIALEALNLATLNVFGFGIMLTGGLAWAFDISNAEDLRRRARGHMGETGATTDEEAEREMEEWVAKVLLRRNEKTEESGPTKGNAG